MQPNSLTELEMTRKRFLRLLSKTPEERSEDDLFELMRLTANFKVFESLKMSKIHKEICKNMSLKSLSKGEIIFKQGDEGDAYYYILRGSIDLYKYDVDEIKEKIILRFLTSLSAGNGFGELALLYDCPRTASAIPNSETDLVVIKKRYYTRLVKDLHEKELMALMKFYYSIIIFKKEPISNILKYCLRTNKKALNSYEPFLYKNDFLNEYCIIKTGSVKSFIKIKINKNIIVKAPSMDSYDFIASLKELQTRELKYTGNSRPPENDYTSLYEEILDIMEFHEGDMFGEYYAANEKKIDVYFLPVQPSEIITIKVDDLKGVNQDLHEVICKYAKPVFNEELVFRKLHENLKWKKEKNGLLNHNVLSDPNNS